MDLWSKLHVFFTTKTRPAQITVCSRLRLTRTVLASSIGQWKTKAVEYGRVKKRPKQNEKYQRWTARTTRTTSPWPTSRAKYYIQSCPGRNWHFDGTRDAERLKTRIILRMILVFWQSYGSQKTLMNIMSVSQRTCSRNECECIHFIIEKKCIREKRAISYSKTQENHSRTMK